MPFRPRGRRATESRARLRREGAASPPDRCDVETRLLDDFSDHEGSVRARYQVRAGNGQRTRYEPARHLQREDSSLYRRDGDADFRRHAGKFACPGPAALTTASAATKFMPVRTPSTRRCRSRATPSRIVLRAARRRRRTPAEAPARARGCRSDPRLRSATRPASPARETVPAGAPRPAPTSARGCRARRTLPALA